MDYEEFLEAYGKLSFQRNYQQVIIKTLLQSKDFATSLDDIEKKLIENKLSDDKELGTWWRTAEKGPIRTLVSKKIITKTDDIRSYHISSAKVNNVFGFYTKKKISDAVIEIQNAYNNNLILDPLNNTSYYNIKKMQELELV